MAPDTFIALLGCPLSVVFLRFCAADLPVVQADGHLRLAGAQSLTLELDTDLPPLDPRTRFGVYAAGKQGLVRFQSCMTAPPEPGSRILTLARPESVQVLQRRRFPRVPLAVPLLFRCQDTWGEGIPLNLSSGGLAFQAAAPLARGAAIVLELRAAATEARDLQDVRARICRCRQQPGGPWEIAVQFVELTAAQEAALVQLVWKSQIRHRERVSIT